MEGCSRKRPVDRLVVSKRRTDIVSRENGNNRDKSIQICSRVGCSARISSLDKAKSARPSFRSSPNGKEIVGTSSGSLSGIGNTRKCSANPKKKPSSFLGTDPSESSSVHDEPEPSEPISPPGKIKRGLNTRSECFDLTKTSSSIVSTTRSIRTVDQRSGLGSQETLVQSSAPLSSHRVNQAAHNNLSRKGLRNLKCNSVSDISLSGSSPTSSNLRRKKDFLDKRSRNGESSSSIMEKTMSTSQQARNQNSTRGLSISDARRHKQSSADRNNLVTSAMTQIPTNSYGRVRSSGQRKGNSVSVSRPEIRGNLNSSLSAEISSGSPVSYSRPNSRNDRLHRMPGSPADVGVTPTLVNRDSLRPYNADSIAEVLLALERIEQDEELTYEQLLVLETNLFLSGLNFYDQHRDMRLDIDNMSYEELLALEDRMGSVSTGISEESLSKSLKTSIYQILLEDEKGGSCLNKDVKCSICQEEYVEGEEMGILNCEHKYHIGCIQQWLRMKNWCPICKASADPSSPPSSSS